MERDQKSNQEKFKHRGHRAYLRQQLPQEVLSISRDVGEIDLLVQDLLEFVERETAKFYFFFLSGH